MNQTYGFTDEIRALRAQVGTASLILGLAADFLLLVLLIALVLSVVVVLWAAQP